MQTNQQPQVSFTEAESRADAMRSSIEDWICDLIEATDEARTSDHFRSWLDVQSRFHDYSYRNSLLILQQRPEAARVAGYRTWQSEFDRHVRKGERAIWIWAPIVAKRCPGCGNSASYHERSDCEYDEIPPDEWLKGLVGFRPVPIFDVSQTAGEPLPELDTAATREAGELASALVEAAGDLDVTVELIPDAAWSHGRTKGVCQWPDGELDPPRIEVNDGLPDADLVVTLVHNFAHAMLHVVEEEERARREVEAEAVAYVVGRYFGLDVGGSVFYVAAWSEESPSVIKERLNRITGTSQSIIIAAEDASVSIRRPREP